MTHIRFKELDDNRNGFKYQALNTWTYYSSRYNRSVTVYAGDKSDGATGAWDIYSDAWWVHDALCSRGYWDDGTKICNWDSATVLRDILYDDGYYYRSIWWWLAVYLFGGGEARKNGMRRLK